MVTVIPGQKVLSAHINAKLDKDNSDNKPIADFCPDATATYDLGITGTRWKNGWFSGNVYSSSGFVGAAEPLTNGSNNLGTSTKGFQYLYLKDTANTNVYRIEIVSGVLQATLI